nr:MAG TPA: hypothetical protein [Caudoviricetes sp.]
MSRKMIRKNYSSKLPAIDLRCFLISASFNNPFGCVQKDDQKKLQQ